MQLLLLSAALLLVLVFGGELAPVGPQSDGGSADMRACALACFRRHKLPQDPQSPNRTVFADYKSETFALDQSSGPAQVLRSFLSYRGPAENNFMRVYWRRTTPQASGVIALARNGTLVDLITEPEKDHEDVGTESLFAVRRRKQALCVWNCGAIENRIDVEQEVKEAHSLLDRHGSCDSWTLRLQLQRPRDEPLPAWAAVIATTYPVIDGEAATFVNFVEPPEEGK